MKILLVDDNMKFLTGFKNILSCVFGSSISDIQIFQRGIDCINYTKQNKVDLIFMDYDMPEMKGDEAIRIIKENNRFIKIVAVSMHNSLANITKMLESGAEDYIIKDQINIEELKKQIIIKKEKS